MFKAHLPHAQVILQLDSFSEIGYWSSLRIKIWRIMGRKSYVRKISSQILNKVQKMLHRSLFITNAKVLIPVWPLFFSNIESGLVSYPVKVNSVKFSLLTASEFSIFTGDCFFPPHASFPRKSFQWLGPKNDHDK